MDFIPQTLCACASESLTFWYQSFLEENTVGMLFLKSTLDKNSAITSTLITCLKTKHQIVSLVFLIWVLLFPFVKKNYQQDITTFKDTGNIFVSLNLLVENISHFPSSCDQCLICSCQVLPRSNLSRHKEMLEAVTKADISEKHSLNKLCASWRWGKGK